MNMNRCLVQLVNMFQNTTDFKMRQFLLQPFKNRMFSFSENKKYITQYKAFRRKTRRVGKILFCMCLVSELLLSLSRRNKTGNQLTGLQQKFLFDIIQMGIIERSSETMYCKELSKQKTYHSITLFELQAMPRAMLLPFKKLKHGVLFPFNEEDITYTIDDNIHKTYNLIQM